jgi:hypothetical protein
VTGPASGTARSFDRPRGVFAGVAAGTFQGGCELDPSREWLDLPATRRQGTDDGLGQRVDLDLQVYPDWLVHTAILAGRRPVRVGTSP